MSQIEIFKNPEFGSIRVIEENGNYLFCGTDIAAALGYSNPRKLSVTIPGWNKTFHRGPDRKKGGWNPRHADGGNAFHP